MSIDLNTLVGQDIEFLRQNPEIDDYYEAGMRACVTRVRVEMDDPRDEVKTIKIEVVFSPFDEYNKAFEGRNYYDREGKPTLTAREAGFYKENDTLWFAEGSPEIEKTIMVVDPKYRAVMELWQQSGSDKPLNAWLVDQVHANEFGHIPTPVFNAGS